MKKTTILISQPEPKASNNPYSNLIGNKKINLLFRKFIHVEPETSRNLRERKIKLSDFEGVLFTSKNSIDHYFRISEDMKFDPAENTKFFCTSEAISQYLQKYVTRRKRKIFVGKKTIKDLYFYFKTISGKKVFVPTSDTLSKTITKELNESGLDWERGILYRTIKSDLSDLNIEEIDVFVFFSPLEVNSLIENFPKLSKKNKVIATFGQATKEAATKVKLDVQIIAPTKTCPSMSQALENYISELNK